MPKVALQRAAELTGKTRSTIHRAMQTGRLSYEKSAAGTRLIEVSELDRVFGIKGHAVDVVAEHNDAPGSQRHATQPVPQLTELRIELAVARAKIAMLEGQVFDVRQERDRWAAQAERLLTDQRSLTPVAQGSSEDSSVAATAGSAETEKKPRAWWRWLLFVLV